MENEPVGNMESTPGPQRRQLTRRLIMVVIAVLLVAVAFITTYVIVSNIAKNSPDTAKVLTVADLENNSTDTQLTPETSDASVENLTKELQAKIDKQVTNEENPIETVRTLIGVLCNTANIDRPMQCIDYIEEFLDTKMDYLKLVGAVYRQPDELRIAQWRAEFYVQLVYSYGSLEKMSIGADSQQIDATAEQLKYINLYLEIAQNPANWGEPQTADDGHTWYYYEYENTSDLIELRERLTLTDDTEGETQ